MSEIPGPGKEKRNALEWLRNLWRDIFADEIGALPEDLGALRDTYQEGMRSKKVRFTPDLEQGGGTLSFKHKTPEGEIDKSFRVDNQTQADFLTGLQDEADQERKK